MFQNDVSQAGVVKMVELDVPERSRRPRYSSNGELLRQRVALMTICGIFWVHCEGVDDRGDEVRWLAKLG